MNEPLSETGQGDTSPASAGSAVHDTEHRDHVICPHCGHVERDTWEINFGQGLEGEIDHECGMCGESCIATRNVTVTYSTRKKPQNSKLNSLDAGGRRGHPVDVEAPVGPGEDA